MKYTIAPFTIIHWDDLARIGGKSSMTGRLDLTYKIYSFSQTGVLPVLLRWTLAIYRECDLIFKYTAESKVLITFENRDNEDKEIQMLVNYSLLDFEIYWEEKTRNTPLSGEAIPAFPDSSLKRFVEDVLQYRHAYLIL